jgi:hypothetical protein
VATVTEVPYSLNKTGFRQEKQLSGDSNIRHYPNGIVAFELETGN